MLPQSRRKNLTLVEVMCLVAGSSLGLWRVSVAVTSGFWDIADWRSWLYGVYSCLTGINLAALVLLTYDRLRTRRPWNIGAVFLFAVGIASWLWVSAAVTDFVRPDWPFPSFVGLLSEFISPIGSAVEGLPLLSLFLVVACLLGGRARRYWSFKRWWCEWLGMWLMTIWAIPGLAFIVIGFVELWR